MFGDSPTLAESGAILFHLAQDTEYVPADASGMIVRTARADELQRAGELCADAYRTDGFSSAEYEQQLLDAAGRALSAAVLVAVDERGRLLGSVTYVASDGPVAEIRYDHEAELRMLAVAPGCRGAGIGATLVRAAIQRALEDSLTSVVISTAPRCAPPTASTNALVFGATGPVTGHRARDSGSTSTNCPWTNN